MRCFRTNARLGSGELRRVLLISLDVAGHYSLGPPLIKGYALADPEIGARVEIRVRRIEMRAWLGVVHDVVRELLAFQPQIVGFSCFVWNARMVARCCHWVRRLFRRTLILIGGQEVCAPIDEVKIDHPCADVLVEGEGERPFRQLLKAMLAHGLDGLAEAPGIHYRDRGGRWHHTGPGSDVADLDEIPSAYLSGEVIMPPAPHMGAMIEVTRGCPMRCGFCFEAGRYARAKSRSFERVAEEIRILRHQGHRRFHILDPILCFGRRAAAMRDALSGIDMDGVSISAEIWAEAIGPEEAAAMRHIDICDVGLQSTSEAALRIISRPWNRERFERGVAALKAAGKQVNIYLMAGLPGDTLASFSAAVRYVVGLGPGRVFFNPLLVLRGTSLRASAAEHGLVFDPQPPYLARGCTTFPAADLAAAHELSKSVMRDYNARQIQWEQGHRPSLHPRGTGT